MVEILEQAVAASQRLHESQKALGDVIREASSALRAVGLNADEELYDQPEAALKIIYMPTKGGWSVNRRQPDGVKVGTLKSVLEEELARLRYEIAKCEGMHEKLRHIVPRER
jgi:hypothetical protein